MPSPTLLLGARYPPTSGFTRVTRKRKMMKFNQPAKKFIRGREPTFRTVAWTELDPLDDKTVEIFPQIVEHQSTQHLIQEMRPSILFPGYHEPVPNLHQNELWFDPRFHPTRNTVRYLNNPAYGRFYTLTEHEYAELKRQRSQYDFHRRLLHIRKHWLHLRHSSDEQGSLINKLDS